MELYSHQLKAVEKLKNGSILCGDVGTGKSRTSLAYFFLKVIEGKLEINGEGDFDYPKNPMDLYVITTAKKRDSLDWEKECIPFFIGPDRESSICGIKLTVDSWNNIKKYSKVYGAFFIFDEQRVTGSGPWVNAFYAITRKNKWILLSATPGDKWCDYISVFVANGFYKNKSEFNALHCTFAPYLNYPKITGYRNEHILMKHRRDITVRMKYIKPAEQHHHYVGVLYDRKLYLRIFKDRWDIYDNEPIEETGKLCYLLRKVVNSDPSRIEAVRKILCEKDKVIIFYNFVFELEMLRELLKDMNILFTEWNGQKHEEILSGDRWAYLVQYTSGAEGWNCITTDTIIFFSLNYSYRVSVQAAGRIDRMNTPFKDLHYYHLKSTAPIDSAIAQALRDKKTFNEQEFLYIH